MWLGLVSALILAAAPAAHAAVQSAPQDAAQLEDVTVEGRRLEAASRAFVEEVSAPPAGSPLGRWNGEVCITITGLEPAAAQFMIDRIAAIALDVGVEPGGPGCRPNAMILATDDGRALADALVDRAGLAFRPSDGRTNLGRRALDQFRTSDAPVRWWHVTMPVEPDSGQIAVPLRGEEAPTIAVRDSSRLRSNIRHDIGWVIIVVDLSRTGDATYGALADYIAMATLTQLNPAADMSGEDTVINLFRPDSGVSGLTAWDTDYLAALYRARTDALSPRQQINDLVRRLTRARGEAEPAAEPTPGTPAPE